MSENTFPFQSPSCSLMRFFWQLEEHHDNRNGPTQPGATSRRCRCQGPTAVSGSESNPCRWSGAQISLLLLEPSNLAHQGTRHSHMPCVVYSGSQDYRCQDRERRFRSSVYDRECSSFKRQAGRTQERLKLFALVMESRNLHRTAAAREGHQMFQKKTSNLPMECCAVALSFFRQKSNLILA